MIVTASLYVITKVFCLCVFLRDYYVVLIFLTALSIFMFFCTSFRQSVFLLSRHYFQARFCSVYHRQTHKILLSFKCSMSLPLSVIFYMCYLRYTKSLTVTYKVRPWVNDKSVIVMVCRLLMSIMSCRQ